MRYSPGSLSLSNPDLPRCRRMSALPLVATVCGLSVASHALSQETPSATSSSKPAKVMIRGHVLDEQGRPVSGAMLGQNWTHILFAFRPVAGNAETTKDGSFELEPLLPSQKNAFLVLAEDRRHGAVFVYDPDAAQDEYTVRLQRLVTVRAPIDKSALPAAAVPSVSVHVKGCAVPIIVVHVGADRLHLSLPPGSYELYIKDDTCRDYRRAFVVPDTTNVVELDKVVLEPGALATYMHGNLPPWHLTDARGVPMDVRLSDFRGKWVIIDFWGYWCTPCVKFSIPDLMRFADKYAAQKDQFVILTFHAPDVGNYEALEPHLKRLRESVWQGRGLPFPVLLDGTRRTVKAWKVRSYPTVFVIDPEGKLVYAHAGAGPWLTIERFFLGKLRRPAEDTP